MKQLRHLLFALMAILSVQCAWADDSIYVWKTSGIVDAFSTQYLDTVRSDFHRQYLSFTYPSYMFEFVKEEDIQKQIRWSDDATPEQREVILGIVRNLQYVQGGACWTGAQSADSSMVNYYIYAEAKEGPVYRTYLSSFYLDRFLITQGEWQTIMGSNPSLFPISNLHPVESISWNMAKEFVDKLNSLSSLEFCLPTEAQWEYAARGGGRNRGCIYSGANIATMVGWTGANSNNMTHAVGQLLPNELGIYDMTGNVFEWCQDWFGPYNVNDSINPSGPETGTEKVARGGCYLLDYSTARNAFRISYDPTATTAASLGFPIPLPVGVRVALNYKEQPYLELSETEFEARPDGDSIFVNISANENFFITYSPSWCKAVLSGSQLKVVVKENHTGQARTGTVILETESCKAELTITQANLLDVTPWLPSTEDIIASIHWSDDATEEQKAVILEIVRNLVCVEGNTFLIGAQKDDPEALNYDPLAQANELPMHEVNLSSFWLDKYQITQSQWMCLMGGNQSQFNFNGNWALDIAADGITWNNAHLFIDRIRELSGLDFSLPTEAQWEFAARGGMQTHNYIYAGSNTPEEVAWTNGNAQAHVHKPGELQPNELGLYDMSGNVFEWCDDWYGLYSGVDSIWNPTGPAEGTVKVARGGTQALQAQYSRITARQSYSPDLATFMTYRIPAGLRLCMNYREDVNVRLSAEIDTLVVNIGERNYTGDIVIPDSIDWCKAHVTNGQMFVYVQPNFSGTERHMTFYASAFTKQLRVNVTQAYREATLEDVIPEEILDLIGDSTVTYYPGFNPPNVEGCYLASPHLLKYSSKSDDVIGRQYSDMYIRFSNQTSSNTLDFDDYETAGSQATGLGAFVTGDGENFSAFFNITGEYNDGVTKFKQAIIVSGRKTASGISDYSYTFVMVDKEDPNSRMVPIGTVRTFHDGDGLAANASWPLSEVKGELQKIKRNVNLRATSDK